MNDFFHYFKRLLEINQLREIFKEKDFIPYVEFLKTEEWKQKRESIIKRDSYKCSNCGSRETIEHYDSKLNKKFNFWFGEDEWITTSPGVEVPIPKPILADRPYHLEVHHNIYIVNRGNMKMMTFQHYAIGVIGISIRTTRLPFIVKI